MKRFQPIAEISNDLDKLIPIGTLNIYDLPSDISSLSGVRVQEHRKCNIRRCSSWKWFDLQFFHDTIDYDIHPTIKDIHFLLTYRYISATYKVAKVRLTYESRIYINVLKVRIYIIPQDVLGYNAIAEWRASKKRLKLSQRYAEIWQKLIRLLDYSNEGWHLPENHDLDLKSYLGEGTLLIPSGSNQKQHSDIHHTPSNFHIDRWSRNKPYLQESHSYDNDQDLSDKLQKIYNNIKSPDLSEYENKPAQTFIKKCQGVPTSKDTLRRLIQNRKVEDTLVHGVKSKLYSFQIKSLAKMFEKESSIKRACIPSLTEFLSPDLTTTYYFDTTKTAFYTKPEYYTLPRGGILAENMGLGKTLICLSLICLTKYEVSTIPEHMLLYDESSVDVSIIFSDQQEELFPGAKRIHTLSEICRQDINQNSLPWKYYINDLPTSVISKLMASPGYFRIPLNNKQYASPFNLQTRKHAKRWKLINISTTAEGNIYRTLFLCNTTLIIVPDNIFHQWNNELKKHIDPTFLRKLFVSTQFKKTTITDYETFTNVIPLDPKELIKFDLIVISIGIFTKQSYSTKTDHSLNNVYWKRLIIDEGHSMNTLSTKANEICKGLYSERRWAVTGTPTSGLTRLHMDEEQIDDHPSAQYSLKKKSKYIVKNNFNVQKDITNLGNIVGIFLQIEPFFSQRTLWSSLITKPFVAGKYGSTNNLSNLLNAIMVRHALNDIDHDIKLPQLHHEAILLEPSLHNKISINLFTAVLAVNAVSSERNDIDYMFHPKNAAQLRRLITNLQRATFHWTGFQQEDIESLIHVCHHSLKKRKASGKSVYNDEDLYLIKRSLKASKDALSNPRWRTAALLHEMNNYITGLPDIFTKSFGTGVLNSLSQEGSHNDISVFGAPHINAMQDFFYKNRFLNMNDEEKLTQKLDFVSNPFWTNYWKDTIKRNEKYNKQDNNLGSNGAINAEQVIGAIEVPTLVEDTQNSDSSDLEFSVKTSSTPKINLSPKDKLSKESWGGRETNDESYTTTSQMNQSITFEKLRRASILGTASAKLSYLSSRLLEHQNDKTKSIVFFEFEDSAYYLTELLDIMGVNFILYATFIKSAERAKNLADFSKYQSEIDGGIVLIMDLRLAAHGLTIISATRVYFISPVWERSVEAQAIKRAHRIGQTKDVYVETLVLKGTLEEEIYRKRSHESESGVSETKLQQSLKKKKYLIDDTGIQEFILKHHFLDHEPSELEYSPFVAPAVSDVQFSKSDIDDDDMGFSLLLHKDSLHKQEGHALMRNWKIHLFNNEHLSKVNKSEARKIANDIEEPLPDFENTQDLASLARVEDPEQPRRKKVRF